MPLSRSLHAEEHRALVAVLIATRHERDMTQMELAGRLETTKSTVSRVESGERSLTTPEFLQWCGGLGVDPLKVLARVIAWHDGGIEPRARTARRKR